MKKITAKFIGSGTVADPFRVDLPTYRMVGNPDHSQKKVEIEVPDDEVDETGKLDKNKIRAKYRGQPKWDKPTVTDNV